MPKRMGERTRRATKKQIPCTSPGEGGGGAGGDLPGLRPGAFHAGPGRDEVPGARHQGDTASLPQRAYNCPTRSRGRKTWEVHHSCRLRCFAAHLPRAPQPRLLPQPREVRPRQLSAGTCERSPPLRLYSLQRWISQLHRPEVRAAGGEGGAVDTSSPLLLPGAGQGGGPEAGERAHPAANPRRARGSPAAQDLSSTVSDRRAPSGC